jgi:pimeloyl-ACP methyl ester carboxylesterase
MFSEMDAAWEQRDIERLVDLDVRMWVDGPGQPAGRVDPQIREQVRQMDRESYAHNLIDGKPQPLAPAAIGRLEEIRVPTLVVLGDLDTTGVLAVADILTRRIPGARRVVFPGTAHMLTMEEPAEFARIVLDFLTAVYGG